MANASAGLRWLARVPPDLAAVEEVLQAIVTNGHRAGDIIARMRVEMQKVPTHPVLLDLNAVIAEVVERTHHEAQRAAVQVQTDLTAALPRVVGDPVQP